MLLWSSVLLGVWHEKTIVNNTALLQRLLLAPSGHQGVIVEFLPILDKEVKKEQG